MTNHFTQLTLFLIFSFVTSPEGITLTIKNFGKTASTSVLFRINISFFISSKLPDWGMGNNFLKYPCELC